MGGWRYGAGRPGHKIKTDQVLAIDVRRWAREGLLSNGRSGRWTWRIDGDPIASLAFASHGDLVTVSSENVCRMLEVERTPCTYGGTRAWWRCPTCSRRVAIVYWRGGSRFGCRVCWQLAYRSQSEDVLGRAIRREARLTARLGDFGQRPRGMHQQTYERILDAVERCEGIFDAAMAVRFGPGPWR